MRHDVTRRGWFTEAHAMIAGVIAAAVIHKTTPPHAPRVIEEQLLRAYRRGVADQKAGRA